MSGISPKYARQMECFQKALKVDRQTDLSSDRVLVDLCKTDWLKGLFNRNDVVVNLAGAANIDELLAEPERSVRDKLQMQVNVLQRLKEKNCRYIDCRSHYCSSSTGKFYGSSKRATAESVTRFCDRDHVDCRIARIGSVFDKGTPSNNFVLQLTFQIYNKTDLIKSNRPKNLKRDSIGSTHLEKANTEIGPLNFPSVQQHVMRRGEKIETTEQFIAPLLSKYRLTIKKKDCISDRSNHSSGHSLNQPKAGAALIPEYRLEKYQPLGKVLDQTFLVDQLSCVIG